MVNELGDVCCGAVVAGKHVLGVARVAAAPGFVVEFVDAAGAVVALVEGNGYEAFGGGLAGVVGGDDLVGKGRHGLGSLETRMEKPETGDLLG